MWLILSIVAAAGGVAALLARRATLMHAAARERVAVRFAPTVVQWPALEARALRDSATETSAPALDDVYAPPLQFPPGVPDETRADRRRDDLAVVVAETLAAVAPYAWKSATIDPAVFAAVSHLTHEAVDSVGSLAAATEDWPGFAAWAAGAEASRGLLYKLRGHVGEWIVADHLTDGGRMVEIPEASNQPGHDLWVDGHPINVKTTADAARSSAAALRSHPDVAVIVPGDAERLPEDAIHFGEDQALPDAALHVGGVFVDDALSVSDATTATADALDAASGTIEARLPWITIARSSLRELSLWNDGMTNLGRATKNVAIDAATIGGGAKAGAVLGGKLGTLAGPGLGTAIGAAVGGMLGRTTARELREKPLRDARENFERSKEAFESAKTALVDEAIRGWDLRLSSAESDFAVERQRAHSALTAATADAREQLRRATELTMQDRVELRAAAMRATIAEISTATSHQERTSWIVRLWPDDRYAWARAAAPYLEAEVHRLTELESVATQGPDHAFLEGVAQTVAGRALADGIVRRNARWPSEPSRNCPIAR